MKKYLTKSINTSCLTGNIHGQSDYMIRDIKVTAGVKYLDTYSSTPKVKAEMTS